MKAITLWRPWDQAILFGGKRIENRPWKPWNSVIGKRVALHAGNHYDHEGARWMRDWGLYIPPTKDKSLAGAVVGVATITGYVTMSDSPWFFGPFGWTLDNVIALSEPIQCRGFQGLWNLPYEVMRQLTPRKEGTS